MPRVEDNLEPSGVNAYRLDRLEETVNMINLALSGIRETLNTLAALEIRHTETRGALDRAFAAVKDLDKRVEMIEVAMPVLKMTSTWVKAGVVTLVGIILLAAIKIALKI